MSQKNILYRYGEFSWPQLFEMPYGRSYRRSTYRGRPRASFSRVRRSYASRVASTMSRGKFNSHWKLRGVKKFVAKRARAICPKIMKFSYQQVPGQDTFVRKPKPGYIQVVYDVSGKPRYVYVDISRNFTTAVKRIVVLSTKPFFKKFVANNPVAEATVRAALSAVPVGNVNAMTG